MVTLSTLLLFVVGSYLILAERVFREDKELLVFDTNRSNTQELAAELDGSIRRVVEKIAIIAQLMATTSQESHAIATHLFEEDPELLGFQLIGQNPARAVSELFSARKMKAAHLTLDRIKTSHVLAPPATRGIKKDEALFVDNRSLPEAPLYLIRVPLEFKNAKSIEAKHGFIQALVDATGWLERFGQKRSTSLTFAVTAEGRIFSHPRLQMVLDHQDMRSLEPVRAAEAQDFAVRQLEFENQGKRYLGIYQKATYSPLVVVSMTEKATALAARGLLLEKTLYFSLLIITAVFLISLLFASSLSTPLLRLVKATREIAAGRFDSPIEIDTHDEIGVLARSFEQMSSELKSSRLLMERYNTELESKVDSRTQELATKNADMLKQQEALLRATRLAAVGETAGQAAHEVLNPLTAMISRLEAIAHRIAVFSTSPNAPLPTFRAILEDWRREFHTGGYEKWSQSLKKPSLIHKNLSLLDEDLLNFENVATQLDSLSSELTSDLMLILRESHRIARIVDGMRGMSRFTKGQRLQLDLTVLIEECIRVQAEVLTRHHIQVTTHFEGRPIFVRVDPDEMRQVFSNLIKNSVDAIDTSLHDRRQSGKNEKGNIEIQAYARADQVQVRIRDNGSGIRSEDGELVFDADFSTKGAEGTGFGLSICRRLVRAAGGDLTLLKSIPGQLTEFEITLPLAPEELK